MQHALLKIIVLAGLAFGFSTPAKAEQGNYKLSYDVYAGGMHALRSTYAKERNTDQYDVMVTAETNGFIGRLFPWSGAYESSGIIRNSDMIPVEHVSITRWKKDKSNKKIVFDKGEATKMIETEDGESETKTDFKPVLVRNASDMLTATLLAFQDIDQTDSCNTSIAAFDGKRKFNIRFSKSKKTHIEKSKYSVFSGPALKCTVTVEPLEGFKEKDMSKGWMAVQNHTRKRGRLPEVWFGRLHDDGELVPVRVEISSNYGGVVGHLTNMHMPDLSKLTPAAGDAE
ncbi:MAG: DUF3108 domain-containing protein [Pseudomonadota bacterium]